MGVEAGLCRTDSNLKTMPFWNIWEKKCDNLGEISSRDLKNFGKRKFRLETEKERRLKLIQSTKKFINQRRYPMTLANIIGLLIMQNVTAYQSILMVHFRRSAWQKTIDEIVRNFNRSKIYRGA